MKNTGLTRFSVSMPQQLVSQLDTLVKTRGYANRSQAIGEMVRSHLVEHRATAKRTSAEIAGTITLVYDHHKPHIQALLTDTQHDHGKLIISTMHVHLNHHNCMEILAVRGSAQKIKAMADRLLSVKGVKHGKLTVTTTGVDF